MECIILSVKDTYMDAQEDMHMNDYFHFGVENTCYHNSYQCDCFK